MWYAVETVFINGKFFDSKCVFTDDENSPVGHCYCSMDEEPMNRRKTEFGGKIEIHLDWFESKELAKKFCDGEITYMHVYDAYYKKSIKSTLRRFKERKIVKVDPNTGVFPCRGIYKDVLLEHKPFWVR